MVNKSISAALRDNSYGSPSLVEPIQSSRYIPPLSPYAGLFKLQACYANSLSNTNAPSECSFYARSQRRLAPRLPRLDVPFALSLELPEKNKNKQSTKSLGTDCRQRRWQHLLPRPACRLALPHCLAGGAAVGSSALLAQCHTAEHQQQRSTWTENWAALCQLLREKCKGVLPLFSVPAYVCVCNTIR